MIRRAVDDERLGVVRADDAAEIRKKARFQIRVEQWPPVFRAKNNVCQQMGEGVRHKISCGTGWFASATEWRAIVAHGDNRGNDMQNGSSPGWGGRNGLLNHGFLPPLPGLGKFVGGRTHSWRYGLLPGAAPQLKRRR